MNRLYSITFSETSGDNIGPEFFYVVKMSAEMPFVLLRIIFLGGVSGKVRNKVKLLDEFFKCIFLVIFACNSDCERT